MALAKKQRDYSQLDLSDTATHIRPDTNEMWQAIRDNSPIYQQPHPEKPFWVISRYEDVHAMYRNTAGLSSIQGNVLDTLQNGGDSASGKMMAVSDGKRHKAIRAELSKSFRPASLEVLGTQVKGNIATRLPAVLDRRGVDFAKEFARYIPLDAICSMMGVHDEAGKQELHEYSTSALAANDIQTKRESNLLSRKKIILFFARLVDSRKDDLGDDLVSRLIQQKDTKLALSHEEVLLNCYSLLLGGDETTRLTIIGMIKTFFEHPAQWELLKEDRSLIPGAVEEILRWCSAAIHVARVVVEDFQYKDTLFKKGEVVTLWNVSANFDEEKFENPTCFDITRTPNPHITFALGSHFCLGSVLAKIEISAVLEAMLDTVDTIEFLGSAKPIYSTFMRGFHELPVHLHSY